MHKVQFTIPYKSGVPEDVITNTLYVRKRTAVDVDWVVGDDEGTLPDLKTKVVKFFSDCYGATYGAAFMAPYIDKANCRIKVYDMDDAPPRIPDVDESAVLTNLNSTFNTVPSEVACVASFAADVGSGDVAARKRGRIYLGGLGPTTIEEGVNAAPRFLDSFCTCVAQACEDFQSGLYGVGWHWVVYSPTLGTNSRIHRGWVDDAFDTQRRRGVSATMRVNWSD